MKRYLLLTGCLFILASCSAKRSVVAVNASNKPAAKVIKDNKLTGTSSAELYISRFKSIAIEEMNKNGIPASIKLAQGLLESGNGNSTLAMEANNHFGIKCNVNWTGKTILRDDDESNECFRVYNNPEESFKDHSEFLKRKRYAFLFELDKNDYKGWAYGLKQAGYATNPKYPELLISLVERYELDQYDKGETLIAKIKREDKVLEEIADKKPADIQNAPVKVPVAMKIYEVRTGDTLYSISKRYGLSVDDIKILNNINGADIKLGQLLLVSK